MAERLARALPNGRCLIVPGARHLLPIEHAAVLAGLVQQFLDEPDERETGERG